MNQLLKLFGGSFLLLTAVSTITLAGAEGGFYPHVLTLGVAVFALAYIDQDEGRGLPEDLAAWLGLAALLFAVFEWAVGTIEARIISLAHVVSHLLAVVLLLKKTPTYYWWICALCTMQMALASTLIDSNDSWFGLSCLGYLCVALWTLSLFSVYRTVSRLKRVNRRPVQDEFQSQVATVLPWEYQSARGRGSIQTDAGSRGFVGRFVAGVAVLSVMSIAVAAGFFAFIPRLSLAGFSLPSDPDLEGITPEVGFTERVRLGEIASIMESSKLAFVVTSLDLDTQQPVPVERVFSKAGYAAPLFRGSTMEIYRDRTWEAAGITGSEVGAPGPPSLTQRGYTRLDIALEDLGSRVLPSVPNGRSSVVDDQERRLMTDLNTRTVIVKTDNKTAGRTRYQLFFPPVTGDTKRPTIPVAAEEHRRLMNTGYIGRGCLRPPEGFSRVGALANSLVERLRKSLNRPPTVAEISYNFENYFRNSPEFTYTLNLSIQDPTVDPVEDFIFNRKSGHCEYYASSLALMLKLAGVPSRLVTGFKGGEWSRTRSRFEVGQRHAHAWVEAYDFENRTWLILDPTPGRQREEAVNQIATVPTPVNSWGDNLQVFWQGHVANVSFEQQKQLLYDPLMRLGQSALQQVDRVRKLANWELIRDFIYEFFRDPRRLFSVKGAALVATFFGLLVLLIVLVRRLVGAGRAGSAFAQNAMRQDHTRVAVFERFVAVAESLGYRMGPADTPREFAERVVNQAALPATAPDLAELPPEIVQLFYGIRFGGHAVPQGELDQMNDRVTGWRDAIREGRSANA